MRKKSKTSKKGWIINSAVDGRFQFAEKILEKGINYGEEDDFLMYLHYAFVNAEETLMYCQTLDNKTLQKAANIFIRFVCRICGEMVTDMDYKKYLEYVEKILSHRQVKTAADMFNQEFDRFNVIKPNSYSSNRVVDYSIRYEYPFIHYHLVDMEKEGNKSIVGAEVLDTNHVIITMDEELYYILTIAAPNEISKRSAERISNLPDIHLADFDTRYHRTVEPSKTVVNTKDINVFPLWFDIGELIESEKTLEEINLTIYRPGKVNSVIEAIIERLENTNLPTPKVNIYIERNARMEYDNNKILDKLEAVRQCLQNKDKLNIVEGDDSRKVHIKVLSCKFENPDQNFMIFSTGNFNEQTFSNYGDYMLISKDPEDMLYVDRVFTDLMMTKQVIFNSVTNIVLKNIYEEIEKGSDGFIGIQVNHLDNPLIISALKKAVQKGVTVKLIVRTIKGYRKKELHSVTVIGEVLEHYRVFIFGKDSPTKGYNRRVYISSSDILYRNLFERYEGCIMIDGKSAESIVVEFANKYYKNNKTKK